MVLTKINASLSRSTTSKAIALGMEHLPVAVGLFYLDGCPIYLNRSFRVLHNLDNDKWRFGSLSSFLNSKATQGWAVDPNEYMIRLLADLLKTGEHRRQVEINDRILDIHDVLIDDDMIITTQKDITERILEGRHIAFLATHDLMTGLANRAHFESCFAQAAAQHAQNHSQFSVLMVDLDRFKQINDNFGHAAGDAVLKEIACRFRAAIGREDFVARLGGDEFAFLCSGNETQAQALALRLVDAVALPVEFEGNSFSVGVSIGGCVFPDHGQALDQLLRIADEALYRAKSSGHSTVLHASGFF